MQIQDILTEYDSVVDAPNFDYLYSVKKEKIISMWKEYFSERKDMFFTYNHEHNSVSVYFRELIDSFDQIMDMNVADALVDILNNDNREMPLNVYLFMITHDMGFLLTKSNIINKDYFIGYLEYTLKALQKNGNGIDDKFDMNRFVQFLLLFTCYDPNNERLLNIIREMLNITNDKKIVENSLKIDGVRMLLNKFMLSDKLNENTIYDNLDLFNSAILFNPKFHNNEELNNYFKLKRRLDE